MKHVGFTPGPWIDDLGTPGHIKAIINDGKRLTPTVARCDRQHCALSVTNREIGANRRLIADAPNLLAQRDALVEALKAVKAWGLRSPGIDPTWDEYTRLNEQIAAAIAAAGVE